MEIRSRGVVVRIASFSSSTEVVVASGARVAVAVVIVVDELTLCSSSRRLEDDEVLVAVASGDDEDTSSLSDGGQRLSVPVVDAAWRRAEGVGVGRGVGLGNKLLEAEVVCAMGTIRHSEADDEDAVIRCCWSTAESFSPRR